MFAKLQLKGLLLYCFMLMTQIVLAQSKTVSGKVTDDKGAAVAGASVIVKGSKMGTTTDAQGNFKLSAPSSASSVEISFVGFAAQTVSIPASGDISVALVPDNSTLTDVVVVGYGTARKKDLTGSVGSVSEKNFNKGIVTAPDQLIQGKVAGVQVLGNSGQPGAATTVRVRGNSAITGTGQPLYVVDGVPLDGRSARPAVNAQNIGNTPVTNPLNFINTNDIASIDVLKDASATAIYGSRAAYGVVMITTKKGESGPAKVYFSASTGFSKLLKKVDVLNASEYRAALKSYGLNYGDEGSSVDAMDAITRTAWNQNFTVGASGGNENARYRVTLGYQNQDGIIRKSGLKKYTANLNSGFKLLKNRRLGVDINMLVNQINEAIAPVSNDAGATGSIIGHALQWNPTQALKFGDSLNILQGDIVNPLGMSEAYNDHSVVNTVLASISPYYKITDDLEYRILASANYSSGVRRTSIQSWINLNDVKGKGWAGYANNELLTKQFTQTLSYNKKLSSSLNLNAVIGYEYQSFSSKGASITASGFQNYPGLDYTDYLQGSNPGNRNISSFNDPVTELKSYFGRATLNYKDRYIVTGTLRSDGSTKFGSDYKTGYFPSFAAAWNVTNEDFLKGNGFVNLLKLRVGWGKTGNQEFPSGASQKTYNISSGGLSQAQNANSSLKWQSDRQTNIGVDFGILKNRIYGTVDYFDKLTTDPVFPTDPIQPAPPGIVVRWYNIDGNISNKGVEATLNGDIISKKDLTWTLGVNATFIKNVVNGLVSPISTGSLSGQGLSETRVEQMANGHPMNVFYTRHYLGLDKDGQAMYEDKGNTFYYVGSPIPTTIVGLSTSVNYKKLALIVNMNGAYGHKIYNNTINAYLPAPNLGSRNIEKSIVTTTPKESLSNPITSSSRYIENGNYMKLANVTLSYNLGNLGNSLKNATIYVTGQNLAVFTKYKGFDPEVNTDKTYNNVPSAGIEYTPYPSSRTFTVGINFSLQ